MSLLRLPGLRSVFRWPTASLRAYFMVVIIVATVPMTALASYLIAQEILAGKEQLESGLRRTAASFALTVEREIVSSIDALYILSYSDTLQREDVAGFFGSLTALPKMRSSWSSAFLVDLDGDVLFNTHQPMGKPLGQVSDARALERLKRTGEPVLTDLIVGPNGQMTTGVLVPVVVKGKVKYALGAWIDPASWRRLMTTVSTAPGGFMSIFDAHMRLIARSRGGDTVVNRPLPEITQTMVHRQAAGVGRIALLEGGDAYGAWQRINIAGWGIVVGEPSSPIDKANLASIAAALGAGLLSLAAGLLLALQVARRVTTPLRDLAIHGPQRDRPRSEVRELAMLQDALRISETQRESARERLQAKADEFETLFQSSPIGLAITQDPQCRSVLRNPALAAMLDEPADAHDPHAMPRTGWPDHQVWQNGRPLSLNEQPLQRAAMTGQKQQDIELEVRHADGRGRRLIAHAVPLFDLSGQPRGAIAAFTDITERKQAEESLITAERRLRESQHLVELAQAAGHVGFFAHDFQQGTVTWTSGLARLFELELSEFESSWEAWIRRIHPLDRNSVRESVRRSVADGVDQATFEFRIQRRDGGVRWLSSRVMLTYDNGRQPLHMNGVVVDITQQKTVDHERAELVAREQMARVEAENANRAKDEFLAMLGHELRNPLGAIAAASEVLNRVEPHLDVADRARQIITRQTRHLARLMDDLLDVARVISGKVLLVRQPLQLGQIAQRVVHTLEMAGQLQSHRLETHIEEVWVNADATRMEQVINNLLSNALKYTPDQGHISLSLRRVDDTAVLEVRDSGVGMSPDLIARVFDLFVQGERSLDRRQGGLGIGLTLVRRLTELHGGRVTVHSDGPNRGCVFTVTLPLVAGAAPVAAVQPAAVAASRQVVVVEDNDDAREALCAMLTLAHHETAAASDGEQGLRLILEREPDVALVDIGLPGLTGYEVARELRSAGYTGRLIALSGYGQPSDVERARAAGFDDHLVKPVDPVRLEQLLAQLPATGNVPC